MLKEQLRDLNKGDIIYDGEGSIIYRLDDGRFFKHASSVVMQTCDVMGISYERKVNSTRAKCVSEIVSPLSSVYDMGKCIGYTMDEVKGVTINQYYDIHRMCANNDLFKHYELFKKIEDVVKKANEKGIIMPDLCSLDNFMIQTDGSLRVIDYDGLQFGMNDASISMSTSLGDPRKYVTCKKYCKVPFHFNTEIDKTGLTILMFLMVFNMDLTKIGYYSHDLGSPISFEDIFSILNIDDMEFINKVAYNISNDKPGDYIADDLYRIASNYKMSSREVKPDVYIKRLERI